MSNIENEAGPRAAPVVRAAAKEDGVDLRTVKGTGVNGAITKADYEAHTGKSVSGQQEYARETRAPMHHLKEDADTLTINGQTFTRKRYGMDHSIRKTIDIPEKLKNNELHYRVVIDEKGKLERAKSLDYQIVDNLTDPDTGETVNTKFRMGTKKDGSSLYGYLMAVPKKWKSERDQAAEKERRTKEHGMFTAPIGDNGQPLGNDFYNKGSHLQD